MAVPELETSPANNTILVVEDDVQLRFLISDILRSDGFTVIEAATTDQAMSFLRIPSNNVSLIFADVRLPGELDGVGLAQKVQDEFPAVRIILTSGHIQRSQAPAGVVFIPKPYILARVITEVRAALKLEP